MDTSISKLPFRLGTTSYIIADEIVPNVNYLVNHVRDVELVLFELDNGPSNIPDAGAIRTLKRIAAQHDLSYTVHLPLDLHLGGKGEEKQHISLLKARRVIETTIDLNPVSFVTHLDGREVFNTHDTEALAHWQNQAVRALEIVAGWAGGAGRLAVENLEGYPIDFWEPVVERFPAGRCVDIGHLWLDGHDPLPYLARALARTRVIHLHGSSSRDHQSLAFVPPEKLDAVLAYLIEQAYHGVVTLEIFGEADLHTSLAAFAQSLARLGWG
jgi:sugar phosphate isomerase/epimerase